MGIIDSNGQTLLPFNNLAINYSGGGFEVLTSEFVSCYYDSRMFKSNEFALALCDINDLKRIIEQRLELSSKITAVKPDHLEFSYNNGECRRVPVRWAGRVIPDQLYFISHVEYLPDSVDIYASPEKLDSIRAVYTEALNYVNFRDTLTVDCQLAHIPDVKIVPDQVRIRFHTDVLTEETISNVPIHCINLPEGKVLRTFPRYAKVHFVAGVSQIRTLRAEDFLVVADFREIMVSHKEKCNLYLREVPRGVSRAVLDTKQVDYLIEEE